jgi:hypothetical protein
LGQETRDERLVDRVGRPGLHHTDTKAYIESCPFLQAVESHFSFRSLFLLGGGHGAIYAHPEIDGVQLVTATGLEIAEELHSVGSVSTKHQVNQH